MSFGGGEAKDPLVWTAARRVAVFGGRVNDSGYEMPNLSELILRRVGAYILVQRIIGADKLRELCIERLRPKSGECILDVGCGPAYYFDQLPSGIEYHGFDTECRYIDYARDRYGGRGSFYCRQLDRGELDRLPRPDGVLLLGLLHHIDDDTTHDLLAMLGARLAPGGRVVTLDTCFHESQTAFRRAMAKGDRGEFVRHASDFAKLGRAHFGSVKGELVTDVCRIPSTYYLMELSEPVAHRQN